MISTRIAGTLSCAFGLLLAACTAPEAEENIASKQLADGEDDASVITHTLPSSMNCGEQRQVTVDMMNYGSTWQPGTHFLQAFGGPAPFEAPTQIDLAHAVEYGHVYQFSFPLRAPAHAVTARSQWRMQGSGWFGDTAGDSPDPLIQVNCAAPQERARVVGWDFPDSVECGETFDARVTFRNDGQTTWSTAEHYRLEGHPGNPFHGPPWVNVGGNVDPEHSHTFDMTLTAPSAAGNYPNSWQMTSDAAGPFNDVFHRSIPVNCENPEDNAAISHTIPHSVQCGGIFSFTVTVQNTGTTSWRSYPNPGAQGYYLGLTDDSVPLGETRYFFPPNVTVERGEFYTFTIVMEGPPTADTYYIAFQMFNRDRNDSFGPRAAQNLESTCNWENARVEDHGLAPEVNCGEPYLIRVKMLNTGLWTWTHEGEYRLNNVGSLPFHPFTPHIALPPNIEVRPGFTHTFETWLTAPFVNGQFPQGWQMISWTGAEFGQRLFRYVDVRCDPYASKLTSVSMPTELQCGQIYPASLTYQNRGTKLWARDWGDKLGAIGGTDPFGPAQVQMPGYPVVAPGESKTFQFNMTGPYAPPNDYPSDWSMFHGDVPFGQREERSIRLNCSPLDARLIGFAADRASCEPEVDMFVTIQNTGFRTWGVSAGVQPQKFSFVQPAPMSPFSVLQTIEFPPESFEVAPGETYTFPIRFRRAPNDQLRPSSSWHMQIERPGAGDRSDGAGPEQFGAKMRIPVPRMPRHCQ